MRWIDKYDIEAVITEDWRLKAEEALEKLKQAATSEERKQIISRYASLWGKDEYRNLVPQHLLAKCWYCEIKIERADIHTDHFRPKNKVIECPKHEGYWWLAFDWENYRCICTYCNERRNLLESEGGKGCHFPLMNEKNVQKPHQIVYIMRYLSCWIHLALMIGNCCGSIKMGNQLQNQIFQQDLKNE